MCKQPIISIDEGQKTCTPEVFKLGIRDHNSIVSPQ